MLKVEISGFRPEGSHKKWLIHQAVMIFKHSGLIVAQLEAGLTVETT